MQLTKEEISTVHEAIFLTFLMDLANTYHRQVSLDQAPLRALYVRATQRLMDTIHADLVEVKKKLKAADIKYVELDRTKHNALHYQYFCRGYEDTFSIYRDWVKSQLRVRLGEYVKRMERQLKP